MINRTLTVVVALGLTVLMAACVDRSPTGPTPGPPPLSPQPSPPPVSLVGGTLTGVVFELTSVGRAPVAGVEVYCDACGPVGHTGTFTDASGVYRLEGAPAGLTRLLLSKAGYKLPRPDWTLPNPGGIGWMGGMDATVNGDTQFDIEIVRQ